MQCSVDLATELQVSHSEPSTHSPAVGNARTCVLHWDRVGSHAIVESLKGFHNWTQLTCRNGHVLQEHRNGTETVRNCLPHVTSRHDPPRSSTLVQTTTDELHSSRDSPKSSTRSANKEQARHRIQQRSATMFAVYLLCVLCATFVHTRTSVLCNTHDERACESSLSMSRPVYRLKASAV